MLTTVICNVKVFMQTHINIDHFQLKIHFYEKNKLVIRNCLTNLICSAKFLCRMGT